MKELVDEFVKEIENILASEFKEYDTFSKYNKILERVNYIKDMI